MATVTLVQPKTYHINGQKFVQGKAVEVSDDLAKELAEKGDHFDVYFGEPVENPSAAPAPVRRRKFGRPAAPAPAPEPGNIESADDDPTDAISRGERSIAV